MRVVALAVLAVALGLVALSNPPSARGEMPGELVGAVALTALCLAEAWSAALRRGERAGRRVIRMNAQASPGEAAATGSGSGRGEVANKNVGDVVRTPVHEVAEGRAPMAAAIIEESTDLTFVIGSDGLIIHATPAADSMLGRPSQWLAGKSFGALVHPDDRDRLAELQARPSEVGVGARAEMRLSHIQGYWVVTEVTASDLRGHSDVNALVLNVRDVSDRKAHEEDLLRRALYDPLTGLANRALFREHVEKALARLRRTPARPHAVLFLDLDGFKTVNDSMGHAAGDEVLVEVGTRLRRWIRPGDTAARLGGDEFAVLVENTSPTDTRMLAQRILQVLLAPLVFRGKEVVLTGSIGIALSDTAEDADELLRNADVAMYTAKGAGKGQFRTFQPEMHEAALRRLDLESDLRRAIEGDQLLLSYQPIFELATGHVSGMEVLVRWEHPERGLIQPLDFIPVAEDSGLIRPMGRFILNKACLQAQAWHQRFPTLGPLRLCVNASVRQIEHPGFYDEVAEALATSGFDGQSLTLEITESVFMNDFETTVEKLCRLKELGLKLAVDDFGTGYSSLSYLRSLPIDILKIDKSFVAGVTLGVEQSAVARAVVKLARTFNLRTVAEGIESREQAQQLVGLGADMGQGYWFSRPLRAETMADYLANEQKVRHGLVRAT